MASAASTAGLRIEQGGSRSKKAADGLIRWTVGTARERDIVS